MMPTLSVVIPCRNDAEPLARCLQSLATQTLQPFETIVVDNASMDATAETARRHGAVVVREPRVGIGSAAAAGYDCAGGEVIVRCDADSIPAPDWLERIAGEFQSYPNLAALTGPGVFYGLPAVWARAADIFYMRAYFVLMGSALARWPLFGSNMALRREVWREVRSAVHSADANAHDDVDLSFALAPHHIVRCDFSLRVGISPRALAGGEDLRRRFRRAFHTIALHSRNSPPWHRWYQRIRRANPSGQDVNRSVQGR